MPDPDQQSTPDAEPTGDQAAQSPPTDESFEDASPRERLMKTVEMNRNNRSVAERELWQGTYSSKALIGHWLTVALISVALLIGGVYWVSGLQNWGILLILIFAVWLYPLILYGYKRLSVHYRLTNIRFFHEAGILRRTTDRIEVIDMDDIAYQQSILERIVGVGTVKITSSDRSHPELLVRGIEDVKTVASLMDEARHQERVRRGIHIERV